MRAVAGGNSRKSDGGVPFRFYLYRNEKIYHVPLFDDYVPPPYLFLFNLLDTACKTNQKHNVFFSSYQHESR